MSPSGQSKAWSLVTLKSSPCQHGEYSGLECLRKVQHNGMKRKGINRCRTRRDPLSQWQTGLVFKMGEAKIQWHHILQKWPKQWKYKPMRPHQTSTSSTATGGDIQQNFKECDFSRRLLYVMCRKLDFLIFEGAWLGHLGGTQSGVSTQQEEPVKGVGTFDGNATFSGRVTPKFNCLAFDPNTRRYRPQRFASRSVEGIREV